MTVSGGPCAPARGANEEISVLWRMPVKLGANWKMIKVAAVAIALSGFGLAASPHRAEAAPITVPAEAAASAGEATQVAYGYGHRMRHHRHMHRHHMRHHHRHMMRRHMMRHHMRHHHRHHHWR